MARTSPNGRRPRRADTPRYATKADIAEIHRIFEQRREWLEKLEHTCAVQFARIAQMQAGLDEVRSAWGRMQSPRAPVKGR